MTDASVAVAIPVTIPVTMMTGVMMAGPPCQSEWPISRSVLRRRGGHFSIPLLARNQTVTISTNAIMKPGRKPATNRRPMDTFMFTA